MTELLEPRIAPAIIVVSSLADVGTGTLRDAIAEANHRPGPDVIVFEKGLTGTIDLDGEMVITDALKIKGPGATKITIDAGLRSRILFAFDSDGSTDSPLSVSGLSFVRGKVSEVLDGGGGAIASSESLSVKGCVFLGNTSAGFAGAVSVGQVPTAKPISVSIRNSSFIANFAGSDGGAIHVAVAGSMQIRDSIFMNNVATFSAGAMFLRAGSGEVILVEDCQFFNNTAKVGGAAEINGLGLDSGSSTTIIRDSIFVGNQASFQGGAVSVGHGRLIIDQSSFSQNTAANRGGALNVVQASLVIRSSSITANAALGNDDGGGGLRMDMVDGNEARIVSSTISGNTGHSGAGILLQGNAGRLDIIGSKISGNHSTDDGGGILSEGPDISILRSKLIGNTSESGEGGGVAMFGDGEFTMQASQVIQNSAGITGGGIALFNSSASTIIASLIAQNRASSGGGVGSAFPLGNARHQSPGQHR
jgi:predicted outer membrane repeat protein